jgi:hypothetical protein
VPGALDIVVIDGERRNECARIAPKHVAPSGLIVFDNSDRESFSEGVRYLSGSGWLRVDFFGPIASYLYKNCTSVFFRDTAWLTRGSLPARHRGSLGPSCSQAIGE